MLYIFFFPFHWLFIKSLMFNLIKVYSNRAYYVFQKVTLIHQQVVDMIFHNLRAYPGVLRDVLLLFLYYNTVKIYILQRKFTNIAIFTKLVNQNVKTLSYNYQVLLIFLISLYSKSEIYMYIFQLLMLTYTHMKKTTIQITVIIIAQVTQLKVLDSFITG